MTIRSASRDKYLSAALLVVALMMVGLVLFPVRFWHHPVNDAVYQGFDSNLVYTNARGNGTKDGAIEMSSRTLKVTAPPGSNPTVDLVTSPLSFGASMDVRILAMGQADNWFSVGIWSPSSGSGYYLRFGSAPLDSVSSQVVTGGRGSTSLVGGTVLNDVALGTYLPGQRYHISLTLDKKASSITTAIRELDPLPVEQHPLLAKQVVDASRFPDLFRAFRPTLSASLSSIGGIASATLENYTVALPSQPSSAAELVEKIDDNRAKLLTILLILLGAILCAIAVARRIAPALRTAARPAFGRAKRRIAIRYWAIGLLSVGVIGYLVMNSLLFPLGTPHFDTYTPKIWSYIATQDSFLDLYHRPFLVPAAGVQGGVPTHEAVFPYGPTKVYYYLFIGKLYELTLGHDHFVMDTYQLEFLLKISNVVFALGDALLIYLVLVALGAKPQSARSAMALFVFNPALLFIMSIWGSTETISLFFMLLSLWLAQANRPTWAWIALALGAFTRPQMLVLAFLLGCVYLRRFSVADNVRSMSWSVIVFFLVVAPLSLAIAPSFPVDYVTHILGFQVGTGQADPTFSAVSPGYYSIWTLPLMYINGQHGINRMWYPRTTELVGSVDYATASAVLVAAFMLAVGALLLLRRSHGSVAGHLPLVAFGVFGWLMLSDSLISRYFLYGLALVILCRYAFKNSFYLLSVGWLTFVILVTAWSHFGLDVFGYQAAMNPLNPANSAVTRAIQSLFFNDRFITVATVANVLVLVFLGAYAIGGKPPRVVLDEQPEDDRVAGATSLRAVGESSAS